MYVRCLVLVLALTFMTVPMASAANAEGQWTSSFSGWLPGMKTRVWENKANNASNRLEMKKCTFTTERAGGSLTANSVHMELQRRDTWTPDENYGQKKMNCNKSNTLVKQDWGKRGKGRFSYVLRKVNGTVNAPDHLHCGFIRAKF